MSKRSQELVLEKVRAIRYALTFIGLTGLSNGSVARFITHLRSEGFDIIKIKPKKK